MALASLNSKLLPKPRPINQHALLIKLDPFPSQQSQFLLTVDPAGSIVPIALETTDVLYHIKIS